MSNVKQVSETGNKILMSNAPGPDDVENQFIPVFGVKTILSLDNAAASNVANEIAKKRLPVKHIIQHIDPSSPMDGATAAEGIIKQFTSDMYPVLVHCQAGRDRSGFATAIWLRENGGYNPQNAISTVQRYGYGTGGISEASLNTLNYIIGMKPEKGEEDVSEDVSEDASEEEVEEAVEDILSADTDIVEIMREDFGQQQGPEIDSPIPPSYMAQQSFAPYLDVDNGYPNSGNIRTASKTRKKILKRIKDILNKMKTKNEDVNDIGPVGMIDNYQGVSNTLEIPQSGAPGSVNSTNLSSGTPVQI